MKKFDLILILGVIILAGVLYFSGILRPQGKGGQVIVYVDGKEFGSYDINENQEIKIEQNGHVNILKIQDGFADMISADCPDKLCVNQKEISLNNETIVCLPNKVVIEVHGGQESNIDIMAN